MGNKLKFAVEDIHLLEDDSIDASQFSLLKVDAFATGRSLHDTYVTEETLRKTAKTILQKPFVFVIDERFGDLGTHDAKEVAGGFVPHNSRLDFKQLPDGRLMLSVDVLIWRRYSNNLIEYFERDGRRKGVSVEIEILESREDPSNGLMEIVNFVYGAITGLGDMIQSAIPNAEAVMAFAKEFKDAKDTYEFSSKYDEVDFTIPPVIKKNTTKALESKKGSSVALALARFLSANEKINPERVRQMAKFFKNKDLKQMDEIILGLYGGKQAFGWIKELMDKMGEIDSKQLSYYSENNEEENKSKEAITDMAKTKEELEAEQAEKEKAEKMAAEEEEKRKAEQMAADEEEKKRAEEEEAKKKEDEGRKFSYAEIFATEEDFAQMFAEDEDDDEDTKSAFASAKEEFGLGANPSAMMAGMFAVMKKMAKKMEKMGEDSKVYMAENADLKAKFAEMEKAQKEFAVASTLKELSESVVIPEDKLTEMQTESEKYSFADLDGWKNYAKALCFDFKAKKPKQKDEDEEFTKYAFPFANGVGTKVTDSPWPISNN